MKIAKEIAEALWPLPDDGNVMETEKRIAEQRFAIPLIAAKLASIREAIEVGLEIAEDTGIPIYPGEKRRYSEEARMLKSALALLSEEAPN